MKCIISCILIFSSSAFASEFRGYVEIDQVIHERIIDSTKTFDLASVIGVKQDGRTNLLDLLGTYAAAGVSLGYKNGQPNSVNMLIWKLMMSEFSHQIANICLGMDSDILTLEFKATTRTLCNWPKDSAKSEENLKMFWLSMMSYDAPEEEYFVWRDFFLSAEWTAASPNDVVSAMAFSILMNPYFLLKD